MVIESDIIDRNVVKVLLVHGAQYEDDQILKQCGFEEALKDGSVNKDSLALECLKNFYILTLDGQFIHPDFFYTYDRTVQRKGLLAYIDLAILDRGMHEFKLYYKLEKEDGIEHMKSNHEDKTVKIVNYETENIADKSNDTDTEINIQIENNDKASCDQCSFKAKSNSGLKTHNTRMHINSDNEKDNQVTNVTKQNPVTQSYNLNVQKSIVKKMGYATRPPITLETVKENGEVRSKSNAVIRLNLGLYEYFNGCMSKELKERYNIEFIPKEKAKPGIAKTNIEMIDNVLVDYQGITTFESDEKEFKANVTMYNSDNCKSTDLSYFQLRFIHHYRS